MPSLAETQARVRQAVVASAFVPVAPLLTGGAQPTARLAIHRRHYHASLVDVLRGRFPAAAWLVGDGAVTTAAEAFVVTHPPRVFCMAEFGRGFPAFLASRPGLTHIGYLEDFAVLEWHLGSVSVAVSSAAVDLSWLQSCDPDALSGLRVVFQPGVAYLRLRWSVDELMALYLADQVPGAFSLREEERCLEVRGARGDIRFTPLTAPEFAFRQALASGLHVTAASELALDRDPGADPGALLVQLIASGLVAGPRLSS
jgi:hypothetical protein